MLPNKDRFLDTAVFDAYLHAKPVFRWVTKTFAAWTRADVTTTGWVNSSFYIHYAGGSCCIDFNLSTKGGAQYDLKTVAVQIRTGYFRR